MYSSRSARGTTRKILPHTEREEYVLAEPIKLREHPGGI